MSKGIRFTDEFKQDAVAQVVERGYPVSEVAERLGISTKSLYTWKAQFAKSPRVRSEVAEQAAEIKRLKRELARVTEECTILKKANRVLRARVSVKCAFIEAHRAEFSVRSMCRVLAVHFSGFYAWVKEPLSLRAQEDARLTELIQRAWTDSGKVYGYRKLTDDLRDAGETCSENRVARLASLAGITAQIGYKRRPGRYGGKPAVVADNTLDRQFEVNAPDRVWVTDITYIRTHEGWSYFAVVIDLFSRRVVGWSMQSRMTTDLALQALLAAVWRRKPKQKVLIHSDQGSQFTSTEWQSFLSKHNLDASMSRRGNCHDNAVAESFFQLLKRERIRRQTYLTRDAARQDVFEYIEMFYNPTRKHTNNGMLSPIDYETKQKKLNQAGV
ncbi:IS3 family transposase [uncultured Tateyamaria sp.]|uniref:IS3 family transposase n=1 Tax=uncultured Tateyamaria sp. TaxID=455651 RepID=UPI002620080D|nr:IS3 family transposase [uncultured Tateyamaria sp.]